MRRRTIDEKLYHERVAALGCVVCQDLGRGYVMANLHHLRTGRGMSEPGNPYLVIPLCPDHHQHGGLGVAYHASPRRFEMVYGTELQLLAKVIAQIAVQ